MRKKICKLSIYYKNKVPIDFVTGSRKKFLTFKDICFAFQNSSLVVWLVRWRLIICTL